MSQLLNNFKCHQCQSCEFELHDGLFFCVDCGAQHENHIEMEQDVFHGQIQTKTKLAASKTKVCKRVLTSWEEYNYILMGMADEIINIQDVPGFRFACLQIWIAFLRQTESAFFSKDPMTPKLFATYRQADAEILYNKKPKKRKYTKKSVKHDLHLNEEETIRSRRKQMKKSEKAISKELVESEKSDSFNSSLLANMSIESIISDHENLENDIEFTQNALTVRTYARVEGEKRVPQKKLRKFDLTMLLTSQTLLNILFCALNTCRSTIQLSDLIRFVREGHLTFFNPRALLPEEISENDVPLSLQQNHNYNMVNYENQVCALQYFVRLIPDMTISLQSPNVLDLCRRYLTEMCLPQEIADYIERLQGFFPIPAHRGFPPFNYEAQAMGYIIFILKLIFGLDGHRELKMSNSARRINKSSRKSIFVYENWRKFMEYRQLLLKKFYYPSTIFMDNEDDPRPYLGYGAMLQTLNPRTNNAVSQKIKAANEKSMMSRANLQDLSKELMENHQEDSIFRFHFDSSLTPLSDAFEQITTQLEDEKNLCEKLKKCNFEQSTCEPFLNPKKFREILAKEKIPLHIKKSTFPKSFKAMPEKKCGLPCHRDSLVLLTNQSTNAFVKKVQEDQHERQTDTERIVASMESRQLKRIMRKREIWRAKIRDKRNAKREEKELNDEESVLGVSENEDEDNFLDDIELDGDTDQELDAILRSYENSRLTLVVPDYNFWYSNCYREAYSLQRNELEAKELPRSLYWLLTLAANVCHQSVSTVYRQLLGIENDFVKKYLPTELLENVLLEQDKDVLKTVV